MKPNVVLLSIDRTKKGDVNHLSKTFRTLFDAYKIDTSNPEEATDLLFALIYALDISPLVLISILETTKTAILTHYLEKRRQKIIT